MIEQEQVQEVQEVQEEQLDNQQEHGEQVEQPTQPEETAQARNFRELREQRERANRERDEALRRLQELEQAKQAQTPEPDYTIGADDLVEGKHLSKYDRKIKELEQQVAQYNQKSTELATEAKLKAQYTDFDNIVTQANINRLRETYPEIAETINSSPNLYNKAVAAYTMIKQLGITQADTYQNDRDTAQRNAAKPKPSSTVSPQQGDSPLSRANAFANGLTDELKAQMRKEMEEARKGY